MTTTIRIDGRHNGPPDSANGGIACGAVAGLLDAPSVTVRLYAPPPLDTDLAVEHDVEGRVAVRAGEKLVATGRPANGSLSDVIPPVRPTLDEALDAMSRRLDFDPTHRLAHCFVCSALRPDGLGVTFGPLASDPNVNGAVLDTDEPLTRELLWGALDCPSYAPAVVARGGTSLLGSMTAEILRSVNGDPLVCVGWAEGRDGRMDHTASALLTADGDLVARARAVWIAV